jgi:signal transduction histidine kinase
MIGCCLSEIIPDYGESKTKRLWQNICRTAETVCQRELQTVSENGDCRYWNQSITPISEEGSVKYIISILDDVTENVMKRKYVEEKNEELTKTIEMKDEMLMLISHELKTPLSIITSSVQTVELVCKNELSDRVLKYLNKIRQNTYRQLKLVNNILDNTRVNAGIFKMNRTSVDIVLLTKTIVDSIAVFAERKGIVLSFSSVAAQPVVQTDVDVYERILLNLLSNAVKFTPEGKSIEVTVSQIHLKGKPQVCIQVKDSGIGIPSDQKELIFERFGRVDRLVLRHSEGTGIGLYLVKMLVSLLDGEIKVESVEGVGSTFTLHFPLLDEEKEAVQAVRIEKPNEQLATASAIEFSDIYFRT